MNSNTIELKLCFYLTKHIAFIKQTVYNVYLQLNVDGYLIIWRNFVVENKDGGYTFWNVAMQKLKIF